MKNASRSIFVGLCAGGLLLAAEASAIAQQVSVQQPTVGTFSGSGTVSVPNRGRTLIGGVSRGATSRSTYGPFPSGTNLGRSFEGGSMTVGAYIHDFEELDRHALSAAESSAGSREGRSGNDQSNRAYETLMRRDRQAQGFQTKSATPGSSDGKDRGLNASELLEKGRKAEAGGKSGVALAFYRQARDRGSVDAAREVDRLQKPGH